MVLVAEECEVFCAGGSAVAPFDDVVDLAVGGGPVAAGEGAASVPVDHGPADVGWDGA